MKESFDNPPTPGVTEEHASPPTRRRALAGIAMAVIAGAVGLLAYYSTKPSPTPSPATSVRGDRIIAASNETREATGSTSVASVLAEKGEQKSDPGLPSRIVTKAATGTDFTPVHFAMLSGFKYELTDEVSKEHPEQSVIKPLNSIPPDVKAYDGRRVKVTGFVLPLRTQGRGVTEFLLVRDELSCCFGGAAQMNHFIHVKMARGAFRPKMLLPVTAFGTFQVGEHYENGSLINIYRMEAERIGESEMDELPAVRNR